MSKPITYRCQGTRRDGSRCTHRARYCSSEGSRCGHCRGQRQKLVQPTVTETTEAVAARDQSPREATRGAGERNGETRCRAGSHMPGRGRLSIASSLREGGSL